MRINIRRLYQYAMLLMVTASLCVACNSKFATSNKTRELVVCNSPWPGFVAQFVAEEKGCYAEAGLSIHAEYLQNSADVNTAIAADKVDLAWVGLPDMLTMANTDPSLRLIAISDYSDGADGILAKDVEKPADLLGKTIAWEELPFQAVLLNAYLKGSNIKFEDLDLRVMSSAEAATALATDRVDVAITFEPWITAAMKDNKAKAIFTSADSNLIASSLIGKDAVLKEHKEDIAAYFRALEKGYAFYESNPKEALEITAKKLNLTPEEMPPLMETVRLFKPSEHESIVFNKDNSFNVIDSLKFAADIGKEMGIVEASVDPATLYDSSYIQAIQNK